MYLVRYGCSIMAILLLQGCGEAPTPPSMDPVEEPQLTQKGFLSLLLQRNPWPLIPSWASTIITIGSKWNQNGKKSNGCGRLDFLPLRMSFFTQTIKLDDLNRIYYQALQDQEPNEMHDFLQTFHLYQITLQGVRNNHLYFECTMLLKLGGKARSLMFQINYLDRRGELRVNRFNPHLEAENQATDSIPANGMHGIFVS